ncbi:hypothetical protein H112_02825 [Trichophyton rubrum D6]|uniref:Uncharacterized protein n=3 Tax=Trichophyton TaxID=5550 RepID=A0A080WV06_TRIRC|nr:uncharacterized protein TERG_12289 [Trichophyton rubrum CBS 118892]EZF24719.1 hypothetical protein H100_02831 [Trichophyton rubrum MR850]EZF43786.1 hypothetical protein H102_02824 [Trichophyton rubrum CBS 100081]EZF54379.1 hypothetical protein H103_02836 [Trichophyton rubrum CBS 288.86]EZF65071.1 hypothetical protein H104_02816 [Trichophyton rubrum CBS 289.86]EZF86278.1 hypothetical protein H110_02835 [Trichophyton rubrum MR1448]EZF97008.1 hypothetical protein H113_02838 [Trichophyton rubr
MPSYRSIVGSLAHEESSQNALVQLQLALHAYHLIMAALCRPICGGSVVLDRLRRFDYVFGPVIFAQHPGTKTQNIANQLLLFKHQATPRTHHSSFPSQGCASYVLSCMVLKHDLNIERCGELRESPLLPPASN